MKAVLDANVIVKWLFADPEREDHTTEATALMNAVVEGRIAAIKGGLAHSDPDFLLYKEGRARCW